MSRSDGPGRTAFDPDRVNSVVQTLAILGAGAWAVYTFVYEARIKPGLEPPAVSVTTSLSRGGERGDQVAIRSTMTRKNVGQTGVRVLALTYNVVGLKARFASNGTQGADDGSGEAAFRAGLSRSSAVGIAHGYTEDAASLLLRQGILFAGATDLPSEPSDLKPGEAVSRDVVFYADRTQFDAVRVKVSLAYAKEDETPPHMGFLVEPSGELAVQPTVDCKREAAACARIKSTDFDTEFSLW